MPVGIAQVVNGIETAVDYENFESKRRFMVLGRSPSQCDNGILPSSDTTDDTLPWYDAHRDDKYICIIALGVELHFSERDGELYIITDSGRHISLGWLTNGTRYVLRFDHLTRPHGSDDLRITIYKYEDAMKSTDGEISEAVLKRYEAIAATVISYT
ncbi:hypothetical protein BM221_002332 [Beauveria bassiana]|uniref:Uncharacterized protein n=1 Tax=Beauveria bassiana TaxID=176275 RepID=A0A2N6NY90_BEABA|nr:hypothetical protein BM221_002332 [Beauveria bassiana]